MKLTRRLMLIGMLSFGFIAQPSFAEPGKEDAIKLVNKAHDFLKKNGREKLIEAVNMKNGEFHQGELYVYLAKTTSTEYSVIAHPINPKLIGKNTLDVGDVDGKLYRKDMRDLGVAKKNGWVDYKYKNPENNKVEAKTSYVLGLGELIIVCGIYK